MEKNSASSPASVSRRAALKTLGAGLFAAGSLAGALSRLAADPKAPSSPAAVDPHKWSAPPTGAASALAQPFSLPPLPYAPDALEPAIDARTMTIHYTKHHQTYITNANAALKPLPELHSRTAEQLLENLDALPEDIRTAVRNNVGGHANHSFFWPLLAAPTEYTPGPLRADIVATFGSLDAFIAEFNQAAASRFGSGWAWLVRKDGKLAVISTANQDSPLSLGARPVIGLDVWEHAYYLNYQNRRPDYVKAFWTILNWDQAEANYATAQQV
ncbi:superoxide dismutase [Opitutaceae bacterium TAV1]|nr:superoxide dismutase [Opitutaceae bacterium TAV1]